MIAQTRKDYVRLLGTELRHVDASKLTQLSTIIDQSKDWTKLLDALTDPRRPGSTQPLGLTLPVINLIKDQIYCGKSPTLALLNHWAITGRRRPTVESLLNLLKKCNLKRAEDYVCQSILGLAIVKTPPAVLDAKLSHPKGKHEIDSIYFFEDLDGLIKKLNPDCPRYSFKAIHESTNFFCHKPFEHETCTGSKVGEGRFSSVFRAKTFQENQPDKQLQHEGVIAAKLLKAECNMDYLSNEIDLILKVKHQNVLEFYGVAIGSQEPDNRPSYICLIYELMQNGSLLDCLTLGLVTQNMRPLAWKERVVIATKIAHGIAYLHSFPDGAIIHRDIKTANIFIDNNLEPKIGDFTLVRQLISRETQFSQNIIGTSVYMPPEAFRGDISTKFDTFSFGIVLLELLTDLRPFQADISEDLLTYITGRLSDIESDLMNSEDSNMSMDEARSNFVKEILDRRAGEWSFYCSKKLFELALRATETRKRDRPELISILPELDPLVNWTVLVD